MHIENYFRPQPTIRMLHRTADNWTARLCKRIVVVSEDTGRTYSVSNLFTRLGERATVKTGAEAAYRTERTVSTSNFGGTFTFSSLEDFRAGRPLTYRVNRGDPNVDTRQLELGFFLQSDLQISLKLTLMLGARYDVQANLRDRNNVSPRAGFAYAPGRATVIRGGGGLYHGRLNVSLVETQRRFDGARQVEIVLDSPSYPDPFAAGSLRQTFPSVRVWDPHLQAPRIVVGMLSLERTLVGRVFVTATYDYQSEVHRFRLRNLNAPFDVTAPVLRACRAGQSADTCVRPDPARGDVLNLEATGAEVRHNLRLDVRRRFRILNVSAAYTLQRVFADAQPNGNDIATNSYDLRSDWGRAPFPAHSLSGTVNARLPLGLFLTGTASTNSGRYYTITTGQDDNRDSMVTDRPAGVPRNSGRGPKYLNVDVNVSKAFFLGGGRNVNAFANVTNAFNRVHLGTPSGVLTSPNFGRSTSAQNPREIEAGIRFQF